MRPTRGQLKFPVSVYTDWGPEEIIAKAVAKLEQHDITFFTNHPPPYELLYPDGVVVKQLREGDQRFTIEGYKNEVGKEYAKISLYIISRHNLGNY